MFKPGGVMKQLASWIMVSFGLAAVAFAMPLGTATRSVIPADVQQIISVDYRALRNS